MKKNLSDYLLVVTLAGLIVAADQLTKGIVRSRLQFGEIWAPWDWLVPYARIVNWHNTGAAFGLFQRFGGLFAVLAIVVAIAILYYLPQVPREDWPLRLAMGMQLGGALGNLVDRLTQGYVTDFVSVGSFPVFNVADASISVGVVVLILGLWIKERSLKSPLPAAGEPSGPPDSLPEESEGK